MRALEPGRQGFVQRDGVRIGYEVFGDGPETVLFLPTWSIVHSPIATTGLFLNFTAVIAFAVCLASWGTSDAALAAAAGIVAILTFIASIVCFGLQSGDRGPQPVG